MIDRAMHRRDFLGGLAAFGVGVAAAGDKDVASPAAATAAARFSAWDEVELGKTGIMGLHPKRTLECVTRLRERGRGVVGMKVLGVGSLAKEGKIDKSLAWVLQNRAADVLNIGFLELSEIDDLARRISVVPSA